MYTLLLIIPVTFCIACALTLLLIRAEGRLRILDHPNERSLHDTPMPRTGGLAIWIGILVGMAVLLLSLGPGLAPAWIVGAALLVGAVSLIDDRSHVPAMARLAVHLAAAGLLLFSGLGLESFRLPGIEVHLTTGVAMMSTALLAVWVTNLYNFMDGADGLAAGMAVFGFGTLGLLGVLGGHADFAALSWIIAAAAAGFLVWNFPPARIFMGDAGASVLGLLAAAMMLWGDRAGLFPIWIGLLAFSPFIVDASVTLLQRMFKREKVWEAHRSHYYQRLVRAGWTHRQVVTWAYGLMLICSGAALLAHRAPTGVQWFVIGAICLLYIATVTGVNRIERQWEPDRRRERL